MLHIERRKGTGIPYMAHLLGVTSLVMGEELERVTAKLARISAVKVASAPKAGA